MLLQWHADKGSLDIGTLHRLYATDLLDPKQVVEAVLARIQGYSDDSVWLYRISPEVLLAKAADVTAKWRKSGKSFRDFPLFGIPFAVKDNIDVEGLPTTAGCPAYSYRANRTATCVERLEAAGGILIGKTNMDQFATGLTGTRSPHGIVRNVFNRDYIAGGSSSGSAVAVAAGLVSFALGTDTAGSGRIPAGFNNVVGLKPTKGLISTRGVVPACRTLDCVSIFGLTCEDASTVLERCRAVDSEDLFSRAFPVDKNSVINDFNRTYKVSFRFGVPDAGYFEFFENAEYARLYEDTLRQLESMGGRRVEIPFSPFAVAARLLYQGPWLAERQAAFGDFIESHPSEVLPVIRAIMERAKVISAADTFRAYYRLRELQKVCADILAGVDFMVVPTAGTHYTVEQILADPVGLNSNLGYYTNFVNLLDLCALAVPSGFQNSGLPFGVTLIAPAFHDAILASVGGSFHARTNLTLGATDNKIGEIARAVSHLMPSVVNGYHPDTPAQQGFQMAVVGLHLSGQPLNGQLVELGARLVGARKTSPRYRLYALKKNGRTFPGLVRQADGQHGSAIEVEVWELPSETVGTFMGYVPELLCIGTLELENGEKVKGFLCEAYAAANAEEITKFGGWKAYASQPTGY